MKKIVGCIPYVSRHATREATTEQPATQAPTVRTHKTSALPDTLRHLMDKVTARPQIKEAKGLSDGHLETLLNREDILSGRSTRAMQREARKRNLLTVALLGYDGGEIKRRGVADFPIVVRCDYIPRIQEVQATIYHTMREMLEVVARV